MYHSEHGQDRWLEENIFKGKRYGVFVEFGAIDGLLTSNTLFFERERHWSGLLIEANPRSFCGLIESHRPRSTKLLGAVGAEYGIAEFTEVCGVTGWSGLVDGMDPRHVNRIITHGGPTRGYWLPTLPLAAILAHFYMRHIDYMSVDVEGAELVALSPVNFDHFRVDVLDVENNYGGPAVEEMLRTRGYEKFHTLEINDLYRRA